MPHVNTFLDLPAEIGITEAALPGFERFCAGRDSEIAMAEIAEQHMEHVRIMAALPEMQSSVGGIFVTDIPGHPLCVVDVMLPSVLESKRITFLMTALESAAAIPRLLAEDLSDFFKGDSDEPRTPPPSATSG